MLFIYITSHYHTLINSGLCLENIEKTSTKKSLPASQ